MGYLDIYFKNTIFRHVELLFILFAPAIFICAELTNIRNGCEDNLFMALLNEHNNKSLAVVCRNELAHPSLSTIYLFTV